MLFLLSGPYQRTLRDTFTFNTLPARFLQIPQSLLLLDFFPVCSTTAGLPCKNVSPLFPFLYLPATVPPIRNSSSPSAHFSSHPPPREVYSLSLFRSTGCHLSDSRGLFQTPTLVFHTGARRILLRTVPSYARSGDFSRIFHVP